MPAISGRPQGRSVMFVADPDEAPRGDGFEYARPDDPSEYGGKSWRTVLREYNEHPAENRDGLLPAWQLYRNPTYGLLAEHLGLDRLYILSAGWGLIAANFLTPKYDITFSKARNVDPFQNAGGSRIATGDLNMLPAAVDHPVVFLGGKDYIRLFCGLTANAGGERTVFYAGRKALRRPVARSEVTVSPFTNWHYQCAKALMAGTVRLGFRMIKCSSSRVARRNCGAGRTATSDRPAGRMACPDQTLGAVRCVARQAAPLFQRAQAPPVPCKSCPAALRGCPSVL